MILREGWHSDISLPPRTAVARLVVQLREQGLPYLSGLARQFPLEVTLSHIIAQWVHNAITIITDDRQVLILFNWLVG